MFSTIYCPSKNPYGSLKKEAKDGVETSSNICGRHLVLPILTTAVMFSTIYWNFTPPYAFLKKEENGSIETSPISVHRHLVFLFLRQPCFALWNHFRLSSGTPSSTKSYDGSLPPPFSFTYSYGGIAAKDPLPQRHLVLPILTVAAMFSTLTPFGYTQALPLVPDGRLLPPFFYLSLRWYSRHCSSAPSRFALLTT